MSEQLRIPAVFMRGGTSKGVFFRRDALPQDRALWDPIFLRALGSPDPNRRQIDGLGGATSSTSKAVVIGPSSRPDCDVDYLFAQVAIDRPFVDYSGNCGNLSSAVGPFAIEEGMVPATDPVTVVRIWQVNTSKKIIAHVPTRDGLPAVDGDYAIDGVPGTGAEIKLEFLDPGSSAGRGFLPTGRVRDTLDIPGVGPIEVTLLDAACPMVFFRASDLGLTGTELQEQVDTNPELLEKLELIRSHGAVAMGLAATPEEATQKRPGTPRMAFVSPPQTYKTRKGDEVKASDVDLVARVISMGRLHHAIAVTAAVATAMAAVVPGSIVQEMSGLPAGEHAVRIGHAAGTIQIGAAVRAEGGQWVAEKAILSRTARRLMEGFLRVPASVLKGAASLSTV